MSTRIAILVFDELTALDAIGPYEVPSFDTGSPEKAPPELVDLIRSSER